MVPLKKKVGKNQHRRTPPTGWAGGDWGVWGFSPSGRQIMDRPCAMLGGRKKSLILSINKPNISTYSHIVS